MSSIEQDSKPSWKKLNLSFERPYKDDSGNRIPVLYDLTSEGERIYEPKETSAARLETNLRRIFQERGANFFEQKDGLAGENQPETPTDDNTEEKELASSSATKPMTTEELYAMRSEIIPQLYVALGEMSHARDLLSAVLSGTANIQPSSDPSLPPLSATIVSKPPPIISVQAFNSQLIIGNKDEALRKASGLFKSATESMERSRSRGEKYWIDALKIRRANWGLTPAPLPAGSAVGKGADKTSKDFIISYGLEGSSTGFRRRAIAQLPNLGSPAQNLILPYHQNTRLRISVKAVANSWVESCHFLSPKPEGLMTDPENALKMAQTEIIDQEIFSLLVKEAGNLPTASARVSERSIDIDAAQGLDLSFELVTTTTSNHTSRPDPRSSENLCELIYHVLRVFLLRRHDAANPSNPTKTTEPTRPFENPCSLLQPIIDVLQYRVFCERFEVELRNGVQALSNIGIPSTLVFTSVKHTGKHLVSLLTEQGKKKIGGEAVIRMDNWHTLWFTFVSPSTLTAHLSQATLTIASLPQLSQLLMDEIERCILRKICGIGVELSRDRGGNWFIDLNRCVGKWEGCVLNFQVSYGSDLSIGCSAFKLDASTNERGYVQEYVSDKLPLLSWVQQIIQASLQSS